MKKTSIKRIFSIALCCLCALITPLHIQALGTGNISVDDNLKTYHEAENFFTPAAESCASNFDKSWAKLSVNSDKTTANIEMQIGGKTYYFEAQGSAEAAGDGYVGCYTGYITPDGDDLVLRALLLPGETSLHTSVNAVFCGDETFFTLVIGVISDSQNPITKAYGVHSDRINAVASAYANRLKQAYSDTPKNMIQGERAANVDATVVYQNSANMSGNGLMLGQVSIFHGNQVRNQASTSVYTKANSNNNNANTYARNYFGLKDTDISVAIPTFVNLSIKSSDSYFHVNLTNYDPKSGVSTINVPIPYYINSSFGTISIPITVSSTTVETSGSSPHNNQNIQLKTSRSIGISGISGNYSTKAGLPLRAEYKYEGNVTAAKTVNLTATAYLTYAVTVEDSIYGTQHTYTFTTATASCTSTVRVLP